MSGLATPLTSGPNEPTSPTPLPPFLFSMAEVNLIGERLTYSFNRQQSSGTATEISKQLRYISPHFITHHSSPWDCFQPAFHNLP
ncbi:hypothetical protein L596_021783 [Steinernema carpocapsae]|uniref:Uncharacterized protein n=1 Tax=Steinernema carpocapsae TaxID=34508 RepID=A0A4U5MJT0_STECR|nr:hypothetical protein L596_021783 [Steinernema carpocapsae]